MKIICDCGNVIKTPEEGENGQKYYNCFECGTDWEVYKSNKEGAV